MTDSSDTESNPINDEIAVDIPEELNSVGIVPFIGDKYTWDIDYTFSGYRFSNVTGRQYGSDIDCNILYKILCDEFNDGVSFIDSYFDSVYPYSEVKKEADYLIDEMNHDINAEFDRLVAPEKRYHDSLRDRYFESIDSINDFRDNLESWYNTYAEINGIDTPLVYRKGKYSNELDWRYKQNQEYIYAEKLIEDFNFYYMRTAGNLSLPDDSRKGRWSDRGGFYSYLKPYLEDEILRYNANRTEYFNSFDSYGSTLSSFDAFKSARLESEGRYLAKRIKDDIIRALEIGLIPLNPQAISPLTLKRRAEAGITSDKKFYATGQLIESLKLIINLKEVA